MSGEARRIRCSSCGYAPADAVWAINGLCPRCLSPLSADAPVAPATGREALEAVVAGWVDAFNARDLGGILAGMDPQIEFHPFRLNGVKRSYLGHDGVQKWFAQLKEDQHDQRIDISEFRAGGPSRTVTLGNFRLDHGSDSAPFWSLDRFSGSRIVAANHYLTDVDILEHGRLFDL